MHNRTGLNSFGRVSTNKKRLKIQLPGYCGWMWTGIIVHKGDIWAMELNEWKSFHSKNIIYVSLCIKFSINNDFKASLVTSHYPTPDKDWTTSETVPLNDARIGKTLSPMAINSLASVGMAKVKPTLIGKQNQISIRRSEVQVTAEPIPTCRSMTSGENLTEVRSVRTNRLRVLSEPISDSLWIAYCLSVAAAIRRLLRRCCKTIKWSSAAVVTCGLPLQGWSATFAVRRNRLG